MPRLLWRISNHADLTGFGGVLFAGRWHSRGRPVVYCAEHPAGALSEFLVHLDREDFPASFKLLAIEVADPFTAERLDPVALPAGWAAEPETTRRIGDAWLAGRTSLLLDVPSVIVPHSFNVLLNPAAADAGQARVVREERVPLDTRLA